MKNKNTIIDIAKQTIIEESKAIANLINFVDDNFTKTVNYILASKGRVIVTGIGKSANIATKIVATLNSTGTPAIFMHAADAIHGDLGNIQKNDTVICISKSGNTPEIKVLVPLIKNYGNKIVAITGNIQSYLGTNADFALNSYVEKEACPNNLAPTSSTTAQLVIGDAIAVCLLEKNNFSSKDFAKYHPGGALGKKLYLRVRDLISNNELPMVTPTTPIKDVIIEISKKRLGTTAVVENNKIVGIITDGDLRRMLKDNTDISVLLAKNIMGKNPKTISVDAMAIQALETMENNNITQILVEDGTKYVGVVHLHDLLKEGIF
ncbi:MULTISPECIES: KpsF/GutQ family sugar-phosphate isomerase [Flavobacteriaceae]|uniref:KpsF/GutQ family sugar-phosphate isomerase n=2 Tax=Flavobacteriaceae TaxID=49546 RepID=A0A4Y8AUZ7_9FLAO|nr:MULTISPECIES: KpsF/GutQ family sugar-phosphate isomerase [Flavobacteriaceae]TEW76373.1 KpsF/GutQ family sugar-phosphate isomerase [Gramella jeungdoensis]GGK52338.1 D-arabinose 5-phosphate isomerase [Lutibacter litoralis]